MSTNTNVAQVMDLHLMKTDFILYIVMLAVQINMCYYRIRPRPLHGGTRCLNTQFHSEVIPTGRGNLQVSHEFVIFLRFSTVVDLL